MTQQVTKVRVFVASPGDVQRERDSLPRVVNELNTTLGQSLGFVVELVRWETHCQPAMGRPQGVVNEQIGEYDIFIGIMWKRFGTPTGEAESGTEEEFNLAYEAWARDNRLYVAFYFCQAPYRLNSKEESEQVGKVLAFRDELRNKGLVWEYPDADQFDDTVRPHLFRMLLKMFPPRATPESSAGIIDRPVPPAEAPDEQTQQAGDAAFAGQETEEQQTAEQQLVDSLAALGEAVGQEDFVSGARLSGNLDDFQLLRLQLLTSTWLAAHIPSSMLGIQETNRLYLSRERLRATGPEFVSILRMLVNDTLGYAPGWYWFRKFEEADVEAVILHLAFSDPHNLVRQRAFDLLSSARVPLSDGARERMTRTVTSDSSPEVRRAALSYVGSGGGGTYLTVVGSALVDRESQVSSQAKVSKYMLLARTEPDRALIELLGETGVKAEEILNELLPRAGEINPATLQRALDHANDEIRFFAIKELARRGELTVELATPRKEDKYDPVKAAAYRFLIGRGVELDPKEIASKLPDDHLRRLLSRNLSLRPIPPVEREQIALEFYRRYDAEQLIGMADWGSLSGHEAYRALALDHFPEFAGRLREDLETDFAAAAEAYYRRELEELGRLSATPIKPTNTSPAASPMFGLLSGLRQEPVERDPPTPESMARSSVEWVKHYYITAALAGLARNGTRDDAKFGRAYLSHSEEDVRIEAVKVIRQHGDVSDAPSLIQIAKSSDGLLQELAAEAALALSGDPRDVTAEFLATGDEILVTVTVAELIGHGDKATVGEFLTRYLYSEDEKVRTRVMAFFVFRYDDQELESLLAQYTSEPIYYFDVVCCFDRVLYAPPRLRSFYREAVKGNFFGLLART